LKKKEKKILKKKIKKKIKKNKREKTLPGELEFSKIKTNKFKRAISPKKKAK